MHFFRQLKLTVIMKLAKRAKAITGLKQFRHQRLIDGYDTHPLSRTEAGFLPVYVGEERQRFLIPTGFLSHPLFGMLLERAYSEYGYEQRNGLVFPCNTSIFQEVISAVECSHGQFDIERLVQELF